MQAPMVSRDDTADVLGVFAHPDDAEFISGGTMAKWAQEGKKIVCVVATRGDKGTEDPTIDPEQLAVVREAEQRAACAVVGVKHVVFLEYLDNELIPSLQLRRDITRLIRLYRPETVVTFDPTTRFIPVGADAVHLNHPDHRVIGDVTLDAIFPSARDRLSFSELLGEGLLPHKVRELYLAPTHQPNATVDITDYIETKIAALSKHASQVGSCEHLDRHILARDRENSDEYGVRYVERFRRIELS